MSRPKRSPSPSPAKGLLLTFILLAGGAAVAWFLYDPALRSRVMKRENTKLVKSPDRVLPPADAPKSTPTRPATTAPPAPSQTAPAPAAPTPPSELDLALEAKYPMPEIRPLLSIVDHWRQVPPNAFPSEVVSKIPVPFQLVVDGRVIGSSTVAAGTPLKPLRLVGDQLYVAATPDTDSGAPIPVDQTDFKERIEARYREFVEAKRREVEAKRQRAREIVLADPSKLALLTGAATTSPQPSAPVEDGSDPRFAPVKASLIARDVQSVTLEEARSYRWNGREEIGGPYAGTYDTVTVGFDVDTIFGRFQIEGKALLRDGKVHAWIDPITEDPM